MGLRRSRCRRYGGMKVVCGALDTKNVEFVDGNESGDEPERLGERAVENGGADGVEDV